MRSTKRLLSFAAILLGCGILAPAAEGAVYLTGKQVAWLSSSTISQDCVYFTLAGVSVADPVVPNQQWFAVARSHQGFREITAFLALAKATERPVTVATSNVTACGVIQVEYVFIE